MEISSNNVLLASSQRRDAYFRSPQIRREVFAVCDAVQLGLKYRDAGDLVSLLESMHPARRCIENLLFDAHHPLGTFARFMPFIDNCRRCVSTEALPELSILLDTSLGESFLATKVPPS